MFLNTDNNLQRKYFFSPHVWTVGLNLPVVENDGVCVSVCCPKDARVISVASTDF